MSLVRINPYPRVLEDLPLACQWQVWQTKEMCVICNPGGPIKFESIWGKFLIDVKVYFTLNQC